MKKSKIALSKREKGILVIFIPIVIAFLLYQFLYVPIEKRISTLQEEWELVESDYEAKQKRVETLPRLLKDVSAETARLSELSNGMYGDINEEDLIVYLQDLQDQSGFKVIGFDYTVVSSEDLLKDLESKNPAKKENEAKTDKKENEAEADKKENEGETAEKETVSPAESANEISDYFDTMFCKKFVIKFDTDYEHMPVLIDLINANSKTLSCNKLSFSNKMSFEDDPTRYMYLMEGEITLDFFSMGAVDTYVTSDPTRLETEPLPKSENGNPFMITQ